MATIVKTPAGKWKAVIRKTGWPTQSKTFRLKRDVENWARAVEDEMAQGSFATRAQVARLTLREALERYGREVTPTKRPSTQRTEIKRLEILSRELGDYSLAAITPKVVAEYRDKRLAGTDVKPPRPRSANTVRLELALLSNLYSIAIREWGLGLNNNPVANVRKPTPSPGRTRRLRQDEEQRLLAEVDRHSNPMLGWIVRIALETAMRSSEILTLRTPQIEIDRRLVILHETKNTLPRTVPLTVEGQRLFQAALANPTRPNDTDLVFFGEPGSTGERNPYIISKVWGEARSRADLTDFRFHDLRHEAISRLVEAGLSDLEVAAISGHKSMQMLRRYTHLRSSDLARRLDTFRPRQ